MLLSDFFPGATIDDTGITLTWTGLGFPVSEEPPVEQFYKALLFVLQNNVPTERIFDFSTSTMSLYTNPAQQVDSGTGSFLRTGWTVHFYDEFGINQLDPNSFVDPNISPSPSPGPSPSPTPTPGVDPWTIVTDASINAAFGDRLWLNDGASAVILPPQASDGDLILFNNSGALISITDLPGELIIPNGVSALISSMGGNWNYYLSPSDAPGIVAPVVNVTVDISGSNPASALPQDILYEFGTNFGNAAWSNPLDGVRCEASASSIQIAGWLPDRIGDRTTNYFGTNNAFGSWVAIDFDPSGNGSRVNLDAFAWQHVDNASPHRPRALSIEAGNGSDLASATWSEIGTVANFNFVTSASGSWSAITPLTVRPSPYRFVRFRMTAADTSGQNFLLLSEIILGGEITTSG